jgi:hypothetical protein
MALKQQYEQLSADYEQLCQMVMNILFMLGLSCLTPLVLISR